MNKTNLNILKQKIIEHAQEWAKLDYMFFKTDNTELLDFNNINHLDYINEHLTQSNLLDNINDDTIYIDLLKLFNKVFKNSYLNYIKEYEEKTGVIYYD